MTRTEILTELLEIEQNRCDLQKSVGTIAESPYYSIYGSSEEKTKEIDIVLGLIHIEDNKFNTLKGKL